MLGLKKKSIPRLRRLQRSSFLRPSNARGRGVRAGYVVIVMGTLNLVLSLLQLAASLGLRYHFSYEAREAGLAVLNEPIGLSLWLLTLAVLIVFPIFFGARRGRIFLLLAVLAVPFSLWAAILSEAFYLLPVLNALIIYVLVVYFYEDTFQSPRRTAIQIALVTICLLVIPTELFALTETTLNPSYIKVINGGDLKTVPLPVRLSLAGFYGTDVLAVLLLLALIICPVAVEIMTRTLKVKRLERYAPSTSHPVLVGVCLSTSMVLSGFLALCPYFLGRGISRLLIGVDAAWYVKAVGELQASGPMTVFASEPRTVFLFLCYSLQSLTGLSTIDSMKGASACVSALVTLGGFLVMREATRRNDLAILSAGLGALSPQLLIGLFAAIYDGWLAFAELLFFCFCLLRAVRNSRKVDVGISAGLLVLIMLTHLWTWAVTMLVLGLYVLFLCTLRKRREFRSTSRVALEIFLLSLAVFGMGILMVPYQALRIATEFGEWVFFANLVSPTSLLRNLQTTITAYVGGFYSNWILFALSILGVGASRFRLNERAAYMLFALILGPGLMSLILGSGIQWRLLFLIPFPILAALGISSLLELLKRTTKGRRGSFYAALLTPLSQSLCIAALLLIFLDQVLRSLIVITVLLPS